MISLFKHILFALIIAFAAPKSLHAQEFYRATEYGVLLGTSTYFGDLNPNYGFRYFRPAAGAFVRYHINPYMALRGQVNYTSVGYKDEFSSNAFQQQRNLNFKSNVIEASLMAELNFFWFGTGETNHRFTPFIALGVGGFYYNPYTHLDGLRYNLKPLGTEGQNMPAFADRKYSNYAWCFPVGAGIKYWLRPGTNFSVELVNRFTLTDYLDDVSSTYVGLDRFVVDPMHPNPAAVLQDRSASLDRQKLGRAGKQRGDQATKDQYLMLQVSFSFQLKTYKCPSHQDGVWQAY